MTKNKSSIRLTRRDYGILRDAAKYGMVVPELLQAQRFAGQKPAAVQSTLRRLYGHPPEYRFLRPEKLDAKRVYYRLTSRGCRQIGVSRDASRKLGMQAVAERYATTWFISADLAGGRSLLDPKEFPEQFPNIRERLPKKRFHTEQVGQTVRLGYFVTDLRTDVRRLVRQSSTVMRRFLERRWFDDFLRHDRFVFTVLTFNESKAVEIDTKLRLTFQQQLSRPLQSIGLQPAGTESIAVRVLVVPGLDTLIPEPR
ncbi:hypothetical protein [Rhodopirellula sp. P2]|uniref:hypothetical protein n=1 Tax=Rhodopirellula sp. P2 TaxID=2127060 RepID=UPI00236873BC|nr:hypothetical protein [Rhodopirellula sp. P2]WDQ17009.1 hypothetical protein PSR62_00300 [Rhodopirellula sp. P2]|tara:strand:- start:18735 stop:19499 length:765 start_codon:yes stop_codon:yes gene_type:complete